jgi:hypothetical protein
MKERTSVLGLSGSKLSGLEACPVPLPPVEFDPEKSEREGTVEDTSSCNSRLEETKEFHTSVSNVPSE